MARDPKNDKIVNAEPETILNPDNDQTIANEIKDEPLAPFDPRLKKPGEGPLQSNEDPLNGVNE